MPPARRQKRPVIPFISGFITALVLCSLRSRSPTTSRTQTSPQTADFLTGGDPSDDTANSRRQLAPPQRVLAVIGVQTGFVTDRSNPKYDYAARRQALRATWFPPSQAAIDQLEASSGVVIRFVIGHSPNAAAEAEVAAEEAAHGGFMRLPLQEHYLSLTNKTLTFLRAAVQQYDAQYIIKVDDDVYLHLGRVTAAVRQWAAQQADYIGCMKTGPIYISKNYRWYEPQHAVLGSKTYFTHCWGTIYALSGRAASLLASRDPASLRFFANEDVTVGAWMLSMNVKHLDDRRLCATRCTDSSIAVYDMPQCAGLCDAAARLPELHAMQDCRRGGATQPEGALPQLQPIIDFTIKDKRR